MLKGRLTSISLVSNTQSTVVGSFPAFTFSHPTKNDPWSTPLASGIVQSGEGGTSDQLKDVLLNYKFKPTFQIAIPNLLIIFHDEVESFLQQLETSGDL